MLSPHYYWCKRSLRDFKNRHQAKKFAASMFELDARYSYDVYDHGGVYYFVAFNLQEITQKLHQQGLQLQQVEKVYLSQAYFKDFDKPLVMSNDKALARVNGVLVTLDQDFCQELDNQSRIEDLAANKAISLKIQGLGRKASGDWVKPLMLLATLSFLWLVTSYINAAIGAFQLQDAKQNIKEQYQLPPTSFQLQSMVKELEKIEKQQLFFRKVLQEAMQHKSIMHASVQRITMDEKKASLQLAKALDTSSKQKIKKALLQYAKDVSISVKDQQTLIEVRR